MLVQNTGDFATGVTIHAISWVDIRDRMRVDVALVPYAAVAVVAIRVRSRRVSRA